MKYLESKVRRYHNRLQAGEKGVQSSESKYRVWYQNRSLWRWPVNYIRVHAGGITLGTRGVQESQVSILWNRGLWAHHVVESRKGVDILHGHGSKTCQRVACQICRQQHRYQGRGTKRTIFLLVERGGPIGKLSNRVLLTELYTEMFT